MPRTPRRRPQSRARPRPRPPSAPPPEPGGRRSGGASCPRVAYRPLGRTLARRGARLADDEGLAAEAPAAAAGLAALVDRSHRHGVAAAAQVHAAAEGPRHLARADMAEARAQHDRP